MKNNAFAFEGEKTQRRRKENCKTIFFDRNSFGMSVNHSIGKDKEKTCSKGIDLSIDL
jgi:hypothetical protein